MPAPLVAALLLATLARPAAIARLAPHPESARELGGFLLGQYTDAVDKALGTPSKIQDGPDESKIWIYNLGPDSEPLQTYMVFTVVGDKEAGARVTAIQLSGKPKKGYAGLPGAELGMPKAKVDEKWGAPDKLTAQEDVPAKLAHYDGRNYSFEFAPTGELNSIKIYADESLFAKKDASKPDLEAFQKALDARDRAAILDMVCADFEIYTKDDDTVTFGGPASKDMENEESLVARYLFGGTGSLRDRLTSGLAKTAPEDLDEWEDGPHPVNTFPEGGKLVRIVWNFENGKWRVWEIDMNPDESRGKLRSTDALHAEIADHHL